MKIRKQKRSLLARLFICVCVCRRAIVCVQEFINTRTRYAVTAIILASIAANHTNGTARALLSWLAPTQPLWPKPKWKYCKYFRITTPTRTALATLTTFAVTVLLEIVIQTHNLANFAPLWKATTNITTAKLCGRRNYLVTSLTVRKSRQAKESVWNAMIQANAFAAKTDTSMCFDLIWPHGRLLMCEWISRCWSQNNCNLNCCKQPILKCSSVSTEEYGGESCARYSNLF